MEERELVEKLLAGDPEAERYFFHVHRTKLYRTCVSLLGYQDPEAEDVTQEAFIIALRKLPEFEFRSSLYSWLYRICVNLCYERMEKRRRLVAQLEEDLEVLAGPLAQERQRREEEDLEKAGMLEIVESQKKNLGEPCLGLLDLRDGQGKSYAQISRILKVPMGTVMSRLARCKETWKRLVVRALEGGQDG